MRVAVWEERAPREERAAVMVGESAAASGGVVAHLVAAVMEAAMVAEWAVETVAAEMVAAVRVQVLMAEVAALVVRQQEPSVGTRVVGCRVAAWEEGATASALTVALKVVAAAAAGTVRP